MRKNEGRGKAEVTRIIIGNWKMNGSWAQAKTYVEELLRSRQKHSLKGKEVWIAPPFLYIPYLAQELTAEGVKIGAQNCHHITAGAFTGEVSAPMLSESGASFVIVGHSERRATGESDILIRQKAEAIHKADLTAVICIGETLEEKQNRRGHERLSEQIRSSIPTSATPQNTLLAYEPIWSIGTGVVPAEEELWEMINHCRHVVNHFSGQLPILYGGSVKSDNVARLVEKSGVDGVLVGGASLGVQEFWTLVMNCP